MSGADPTMKLAANHSNLAKVHTGEGSIWDTRGFQTTNIFAVDDTFSSKPTGQPATFGGRDRFRLRKRGGRVYKTWMKVTFSAGVLVGGVRAAYADDLGQLLLANVRAEYASKEIQNYNGEVVKAYKRLLEHDITKEAYNATNLAGLPPGGIFEARREAAVTAGDIVYPELEWLFFTKFEDYALTPEALSSEMEIVIDYRSLPELVYARNAAGAVPAAGAVWTTAPAITESLLFTQLIHAPGPEKERHLRRFDSPKGLLYKILDIEQQVRQSIAAAAGVYSIKLDNMRLDSQFIMFYVRRATIDTPYYLDRMQSDSTTTSLPSVAGTADTSALLPVTSFRLIANGKVILDPVTDIENRAVHRKTYFPGSQIAEPIYFIPFGMMLRDARNVCSFQNLANLGTLELELTMPASTDARYLDAYNICHNDVQMKQGDIIRLVR